MSRIELTAGLFSTVAANAGMESGRKESWRRVQTGLVMATLASRSVCFEVSQEKRLGLRCLPSSSARVVDAGAITVDFSMRAHEREQARNGMRVQYAMIFSGRGCVVTDLALGMDGRGELTTDARTRGAQ